MNRSNERDNFILVFFMMSGTILVTSTAFISWYYKIASLYPSKGTDFIAEVLVYLIHIIGMLIFSFGIKKRPDVVLRKENFILCIGLWYILSLLSVVTDSVPLVMGLGLAASVLTGMLFGYYLTALAAGVNKRRGLLFGGAGAVSSIASFLISLPMKGTFIFSNAIWIVYLIFVIISALCACFIFTGKEQGDFLDREEISASPADSESDLGTIRTYLIFCAVIIVLLSMVGNMGFYFPSADITQAGVNLEFSRAFYSIGLIIAGLVYDKNSKAALILCSSTILFPIVSLMLMDQIRASAVIWVMAYIILGFVSVSRALMFVVPASSKPKLLFLAPIGFALARLGEALGSTLGILLTPHRLVHIIVTSAVCICTMVAFFFLLDYSFRHEIKQLMAAWGPKEKDTSVDILSQREHEVLQMLLDGKTYREIASDLYISENTVKYHVKNIYKKYGCSSRKELIQKYNE